MAINNNAGFVVPNKKEKTPSLDERIASDSGRAKQDMQAAKARESDKGRFIKQVADAKSEFSVRSNHQYKNASTPSLDERIASDSGRAKQDMQAAKERESDKGRFIKQVADAKSDPQYKNASTPDKVAAPIPTEAPKVKSSGLTKKKLPAKSNTPYKSTGSKATSKPTSKYRGGRSEADIQAMIDEYSSPNATSEATSKPTSKYRGGRSEADIQAMINEATPDRMRALQFAQDNPDATPFKKGGAVKSGASRGDGCAIRGRTKGKYC
jgi:hypothetical protein